MPLIGKQPEVHQPTSSTRILINKTKSLSITLKSCLKLNSHLEKSRRLSQQGKGGLKSEILASYIAKSVRLMAYEGGATMLGKPESAFNMFWM